MLESLVNRSTWLLAVVVTITVSLFALTFRKITTGLRRNRRAVMSRSMQADQDLKVIEFNRDNFCEQQQSPLFSVLPGEIRDRIFAYTLAEFEDSSEAFDNNTCYRRPEYAAPRHSETALLRTCQRVYQEAFFYPFALAEQILWLTALDRRPRNVTTIERLKPSLALMHKLHEDTELESVRVFAQLCALESGAQLKAILDMPHFFPRTFTVTLRHTDLWYWESDEPLHIGGQWTTVCIFPESLRCLTVQVESLERKKDQIDFLVRQMIENWFFKRRDDTMLCANNSSVSITRWSGSSTWGGGRWLRDETRPETLDYYIASIVFRPLAHEDVSSRTYDPQRSLQLGPQPGTRATGHPKPCVSVHELQQANIPPGLSADEVLACFDERRREEAVRRVQSLQIQRQRNERLAAARASRRDARRARAQATVASMSIGGVAFDADTVVSADELKAARARRRAARKHPRDAELLTEDVSWLEAGGPCSSSSNGNAYAALDDDDTAEGSNAGQVG